ncbi:MAG: MOSC domain-containing protein [Pseudomonadota bacterium]|nr:MOSC domain-containing protein [Pseudomonadota bacterium]
MGNVIGIARREKLRAEMETIDSVYVDEKTGLSGDIRGTALKRQVTLLSAKAWSEVCRELEADLPWTTRRANILIENIDFHQGSGYKIQIGEVLLLVTRQTDPCSRMDEQYSGLTNALMSDWRGGVCCSVVKGGNISLGDEVKLIL